ncbi:MAG: hypothetical protein AAF447_04305 [Myxococcota bacterium]
MRIWLATALLLAACGDDSGSTFIFDDLGVDGATPADGAMDMRDGMVISLDEGVPDGSMDDGGMDGGGDDLGVRDMGRDFGSGPRRPAITEVSPASPSDDPMPTVSGTGTVDELIRIFGSADCSGAPLASVSVPLGGAWSQAVPVPLNVATPLSANQEALGGALSPCSVEDVVYEHDDVAPTTPVLTGTRPASPADDDAPFVLGTTDPAIEVALYASDDCSGVFIQNVISDLDGSIEAFIGVANGSTTRITAQATDGAGLRSGCSNAITYVELP